MLDMVGASPRDFQSPSNAELVNPAIILTVLTISHKSYDTLTFSF